MNPIEWMVAQMQLPTKRRVRPPERKSGSGRRQSYGPETRTQVVEMVERGLRVTLVAAEMGIDRGTVYRMVKEARAAETKQKAEAARPFWPTCTV